MRLCPNGHKVDSETAAFCPVCGAAMGEEIQEEEKPPKRKRSWFVRLLMVGAALVGVLLCALIFSAVNDDDSSSPSVASGPTRTARPTATIGPTATSLPTATARPTRTPEPTRTTRPTATDVPTPSPEILQDYIDLLNDSGMGAFVETVQYDGDARWIEITVRDAWHYEPYQIRLQAAQLLWESWTRGFCPSEDGPDYCRISLVDGMGNNVGGSSWLAGSVIKVNE